jgi:hypothetical protein
LLCLICVQSSFFFHFLKLETSIKTSLVIIFKKKIMNHLIPHLYLHTHPNRHLVIQKCKIFPKVLMLQDFLLHLIAMIYSLNFELKFHFILKVILILAIDFILIFHLPFISINLIKFLLLLLQYLHFQPNPRFS